MSRPKELRNVDLIELIEGKHELPDGWTRGKLVMIYLSLQLHEIFNHSVVEENGDLLRFFLRGTLRAEGNHKAGVPHGPMRIFWPDGKVWIEMDFNDGTPIQETRREFLPDGFEIPTALLRGMTDEQPTLH